MRRESLDRPNFSKRYSPPPIELLMPHKNNCDVAVTLYEPCECEKARDKYQIVHLRELLEARELCATKDKLCFCVGMDTSHRPVYEDLQRLNNIIVTGQTNSGKSVFLHSLIVSLMYNYSFDDVRFLLMDPNCVEFDVYDGMPHLLGNQVIYEFEHIINAFEWLKDEISRRNKLFSASGVKDFGQYNGLSSVKSGSMSKLYSIVVVVDEIADLINKFGSKISENISFVAGSAETTGIHLVLATQRATREVLNDKVRAHIKSHVVFRLPTSSDSLSVLNKQGAELLLWSGDMLYLPKDASEPIRARGAHISRQEINDVVQYLKGRD